MTRQPAMVLVLVLLSALLLCSNPAQAHKMRIFAAPEGNGTISGYVYFPAGGRARDIPIRAEDPQGRIVYQGISDSQGAFRFAAPPGPLIVRAEGQDGHAASQQLGQNVGQENAATADDQQDGPLSPQDEMDEHVVQRAVAAQIRPLQEQLAATYEKIWWHDVMGGLGVIFGLCGLAYGWTARRDQRRDQQHDQRHAQGKE